MVADELDHPGSEVAGALARYWSAGNGPSHSALSTAFALAGYEEPEDALSGTKERRVLQAIRQAEASAARRIVEELLNLLRSVGAFDMGEVTPAQQALVRACQRAGHQLEPGGFINWKDSVAATRVPSIDEHPPSSAEESSLVVETAVPSI